MSPDDPNNAFTPVSRKHRESGAERPSIRGYAMLEELRFARLEAQREANLAYNNWSLHPSGDQYYVYRAAQDRADAAQDALALCARQLADIAGCK